MRGGIKDIMLCMKLVKINLHSFHGKNDSETYLD